MKDIWDKGLIILDTNALLHLFRYSSNAREDFFKALEAKRNTLWIPHQVGVEFHRRRIEIINAQDRAFDEIENALTKANGQVKAAFDSYKRHPSLNISPLSNEFDKAVETLRNKLKEARSDHNSQMIESKTNDVILETITSLYDNRIGSAFDDEMLSQIYEEGAGRYEKKVPPGYEDIKKNEPARYGDLVLWKQILAHVSEVKLPAIFVTDDRKEDWWYTVDSHRHGARPELVEEYFEASGERVHLMTSDRFLDFAKTQMVGIRAESVSEAELLSRESARRHRGSLTDERDSDYRMLVDLLASRSNRKLRHGSERIHRPYHDPEYLEAYRVAEHLNAKAEDIRADLEQALERLQLEAGNAEVPREVFELQHQLKDLQRQRRLARDQLETIIERHNHATPTTRPWHPSRASAPLFQTEPDNADEMLFSDSGEDDSFSRLIHATERHISGDGGYIETPPSSEDEYEQPRFD